MKYPVTDPQGLSETGPAGRVPVGAYDEGVNARDYDERGQRARFASRAGLLPIGALAPCPAGTPVLEAFSAKRALSRYEFVELGTTPNAAYTPTAVASAWTGDLDEKPLDSVRAPSGAAIVLLETGAVVEVDDGGTVKELFNVAVPQDFTLVGSIAVDDLDGVWVGAAYTQQVDGYASRLWRWTRDENDEWTQGTQQDIAWTVVRFWYSDGDIFAYMAQPTESELPWARALGRYPGALTGGLVEGWTRPAPDPVIDADFKDRACYFVAAPNRGRTAPAGGSASVDWTPAEMTDYRERLFCWQSALREQNSRALSEGSAISTWETAKNDSWIDPALYDQTPRQMVVPTGYVSPTFEQDPNGNGPEIRFDSALTGTQEWMYSGPSQSNAEKQNAIETASWQVGNAPTMEDAASDGHAFAFVIVARVENYEESGTLYTDSKLLWHQGDLRLSYAGDAGNTQITLTLQQGGSTPVSSGSGDTVTLTDGEAYVCVTIVCNGFGVAGGSSWRVNGTQVGGSTFQMDRPPLVGARSNIGWSFTYGGGGGATADFARFRGGYKEIIGVLGTDNVGVHDAAPITGELEELEGYAMNAYGIQTNLAVGHPWNNTPPVGAGGNTPPLDFEDAFQEPAGLLFKLDRATGDIRWVYSDDDAGAGVAMDPDPDSNAVFTAGTPLDLDATTPNRIGRINDLGDSVSAPVWQNTAGALGSTTMWENGRCRLYVDGCGALYVPFTSTGTTVANDLQKLDPDTGAQTWSLTISDGPSFILPSFFFIDDRYKAGACGDEFVYAVCRQGETVQRIDVVGQNDTGETRGQETEVIALCRSGEVARIEDPKGSWTSIVSDFAPGVGVRPWSFELYGRQFFGGPNDYRVWDPERKQLRSWTPGSGSLIPRRIFTARRWRGRVLAASLDDRHILYGSAYGDAFDWRTGGDIVTATQAFAGTTAAAGAIPDPITAIMIGLDDLAFIGTTRSVWRLTGDPQTGGQLDDLLATEGVYGPDAWARGRMGELYWVTTDMSVAQMGTQGLTDISSSWIQGRLQAIDPDVYRIELSYSNREKGLYVTVVRRDGEPEVGREHLFWSARTGRWHPVEYPGGIDRSLSCMGVLESADATGWGAMIGFADGSLKYVHPEALDDDGIAIHWRARVSLAGDEQPERVLCTHVDLSLASDQGPVYVRGVAGRTGDSGDDYGQETLLMPGRGDGAMIGLAAPNLWMELVGAGQPAAIDSMRVHLAPWGVT